MSKTIVVVGFGPGVSTAVVGTRADSPGVPMVESATVADAFWRLYKTRGEVRARFG